MVALNKYDLAGKKTGSVQIEDALLQSGAHPQSIKDYIVAIRNNARQWSASTKTRAEINRTGKKPHPQKGGGRSRQGDLAAPQYKGGGIVFGPRPKFDIHVRINKKERRAAIAFLLAEKIKADRVLVLHPGVMDKPKTKSVAAFFDELKLSSQRALVLGDVKMQKDPSSLNFVCSLRNLPKKDYALMSQLDGYSLARAQHLIVLDSALHQLLAILGVANE